MFVNLANLIAKNATRLEEADLLYRQAISMRADYTQAYINRGDVLIKLNRTKEAQEVYERALFYDSNNPDIYYNVSIELLLIEHDYRYMELINNIRKHYNNQIFQIFTAWCRIFGTRESIPGFSILGQSFRV